MMKRRQQQDESFEDFYTDLTSLANRAELCAHCRDDRLVDHLIFGIHNVKLRAKVFEEGLSTVATVVNFMNKREYAKRSSASISGTKLSVNQTNVQSQGGKEEQGHLRKERSQSRGRDSSKSRTDSQKCKNCGRREHTQGALCPAKNQECRRCSEEGHFEICCPTRPKETPTRGRARGRGH